jgi:hypothetical protein
MAVVQTTCSELMPLDTVSSNLATKGKVLNHNLAKFLPKIARLDGFAHFVVLLSCRFQLPLQPTHQAKQWSEQGDTIKPVRSDIAG